MSTHYRMHARNAGFFSNFNGVINRLKYAVGPGDTFEVCWNANRVYWKDRPVNQTQFPYGTAEDGNLWLKFFEPIPFDVDPHLQLTTQDIWGYDQEGWCFGSYRAWGKRQCRLYAPGNAGWRMEFHRVYRDYVTPLPRITTRVEEFRKQHLENRDSVGVHIRSIQHSFEELGNEAYDVGHFAAVIRQTYGNALPTIFLATDNEEVIRDMEEEFGSRVVYQSDVIRSASNAEEVHLDRPGDSRLGDDVLSDTLLLASCRRMIHTSSNIATAVAYINPTIQMDYLGRYETPWELALSQTRRLFEVRPWGRRLQRAAV